MAARSADVPSRPILFRVRPALCRNPTCIAHLTSKIEVQRKRGTLRPDTAYPQTLRWTASGMPEKAWALHPESQTVDPSQRGGGDGRKASTAHDRKYGSIAPNSPKRQLSHLGGAGGVRAKPKVTRGANRCDRGLAER